MLGDRNRAIDSFNFKSANRNRYYNWLDFKIAMKLNVVI